MTRLQIGVNLGKIDATYVSFEYRQALQTSTHDSCWPDLELCKGPAPTYPLAPWHDLLDLVVRCESRTHMFRHS
jgi:hypothetical protein